MTLDRRLRGYLEEKIDDFIKSPRTYIRIARERNVKNTVEFILGFSYGRLIQAAATFSVNHQIPESDMNSKDLWSLLDRRAHDIIDTIQRELETEGIGGNSI